MRVQSVPGSLLPVLRAWEQGYYFPDSLAFCMQQLKSWEAWDEAAHPMHVYVVKLAAIITIYL